MKRVGVVRFLGTNCDRDVFKAIEQVGHTPEWLWYEDSFEVSKYEALVIPGGFSYGDYLRSGALAAKAPVMNSVSEAAKKGVPILGICNGFQILCEAGLLPGVLIKNEGLRFIDQWVKLNLQTPLKSWGGSEIDKCEIPIAHGDGCYFLEPESLKKVMDQDQIWMTYDKNPNGSVADIAGVTNKNKNVAGLMPHPERAMWDWMGSSSGTNFFEFI